MQFSGFIEASGNATSTEEVFQLLGSAVLPLGFNKVAFFALTEEAQQALLPPDGQVTFVLASNYPEAYLQNYMHKRHYIIDPIICLVQESLTPLVYNEVIDSINISNIQKEILTDRINERINGEIICPIHGPKDQIFALCFACDFIQAHEQAVISALQVLSLHFYYSYVRAYQARRAAVIPPSGLADGPPMPLTDVRGLTQRERECLLWTARGKSASTISVILHLSENTINFYVKNAMRKLGTTNRVVAVVLAVRAGLIQP